MAKSIHYSISIDSLKTTNEKKSKFNTFGLAQLLFQPSLFENWFGWRKFYDRTLFIDYNINYKSEKGWVWDNNLMLSIGTLTFPEMPFSKKPTTG